MLPIIKGLKKVNLKIGFTLVELLVAVSIVGILSIISVQSLYDAVSIRSKQYSIEDTSDDFRSMIKLITKEIMEAKDISIPNVHQIKITGEESCSTIIFDAAGKSLKYLQVPAPCTPPDPSLVVNVISGNNIQISNFSFFPVSDSPKMITLRIGGLYKNSLGDHPFSYQTTITPRVSI